MTVGFRTTLRFLDDLRKAESLPDYGEEMVMEHKVSSKAWKKPRTFKISVIRLNDSTDQGGTK